MFFVFFSTFNDHPVYFSWNKNVLLLGTSLFLKKKVFCNVYSCSVNLLDQNISDFIKNEPLHRLFLSYIWDQLFNRIIAFKNTNTWYHQPKCIVFSSCNLKYIWLFCPLPPPLIVLTKNLACSQTLIFQNPIR